MTDKEFQPKHLTKPEKIVLCMISIGAFYVALDIGEVTFSSAVLCLASFFCLPFVSQKINQQRSKAYPYKRLMVFTLLFAAWAGFVDNFKDHMIKERESKIVEFQNNKEAIMEELRSLFDSGDYVSTTVTARGFFPEHDQDLQVLFSKAETLYRERSQKKRAEKQKQRNQEQVDVLLGELKTIPSSDYVLNEALYKQLVKLNPAKQSYKEKLNYYQEKRKEQELKREALQKEKDATRMALKKQKEMYDRQFSLYTGIHYGLEKYVKSRLNDSKSFEHIKTLRDCNRNYCLVMMEFTARNGFGGVIRNIVMAKVDMLGSIYDYQMN